MRRDQQCAKEKSDRMCALSISYSSRYFCLCVYTREAFSSSLRVLYKYHSSVSKQQSLTCTHTQPVPSLPTAGPNTGTQTPCIKTFAWQADVECVFHHHTGKGYWLQASSGELHYQGEAFSGLCCPLLHSGLSRLSVTPEMPACQKSSEAVIA